MLSRFCSPLNSIPNILGIISVVGIILVVIGAHLGGGDHFDGGDHLGGGTNAVATRTHCGPVFKYDKHIYANYLYIFNLHLKMTSIRSKLYGFLLLVFIINLF